MSAHVGKDAADGRRIVEAFKGENRRRGAGEECDLEIAALGVGDDPLRRVGAAESVVVKELLVGGDLDAEEIAATNGIVRIEERTDFLGLDGTDLRDCKTVEVDSDAGRREDDVAGDGARVGAGSAPWAAFLCEYGGGRS